MTHAVMPHQEHSRTGSVDACLLRNTVGHASVDACLIGNTVAHASVDEAGSRATMILESPIGIADP